MPSKKSKKNSAPSSNGIIALIKELWQAAVNLRGSVEPADYKRYVLPIFFLRFLSLRYDRRQEELEHHWRTAQVMVGGDIADSYLNSEPNVKFLRSSGS